jgi:hypothetical protein
MTAVSGLEDDGDLAEQGPARRQPAVRNPALQNWLADFSAAAVRCGGAYGAVLAVLALALLALGLPQSLLLFPAGACAMHGASRVAEGWTWHFRGGAAARRRRRKYQGEATPWEVRVTLSPQAAQKKMRRLAPDLPPAQAYVQVGVTAHRPRQAVAVGRGETVCVFAPPQTVKTGLISSWLQDAPGAALATSSRADQYRHTASAREKLGEVLVLDADGYGPGTNFRWDPVADCESPRIALRRAGALMHAAPRDESGKDAWHEQRGMQLLAKALHAAALQDGNVLDVRAWCRRPDDEQFAKGLRRARAAPDWAAALEDLLTQDEESVMSAVTSAESALAWLDDPDLAAVACPDPDRGEHGLDIADFLRAGTGTVYLIGSERPHGSLTPYFSAFAEEYLEQARHLAEVSGGRLRIPMTLALDEAATTARINLKRWLAVTAGYNITAMVGLQSAAQVPDCWGEKAAPVILTMFTTKVIGGGFTEDADLERFSRMCGEYESWRREGSRKVWAPEKTFSTDRIRMLPDGHVLLVQRNRKSVEVVTRMVWNRADYSPVVIAARES